jgi:hypothetical protein
VPLSPQEDANLTPREEKVMKRYHDWHDNHLGYAVTMRSRPHTIGFALADNPVGILAWVGEKYEEAVFPDRLNEPEWDREILITASLYFFSGCIMTSMLPYYENVKVRNIVPWLPPRDPQMFRTGVPLPWPSSILLQFQMSTTLPHQATLPSDDDFEICSMRTLETTSYARKTTLVCRLDILPICTTHDQEPSGRSRLLAD